MPPSQNRFLYADILRIVAMFAVIVLHLASDPWTTYPVKSETWFTLNIINSLVRWCVPVFVMISGMFFLSPKKEMPLKKLYGKYILRILAALIFWGIILQIWDYITDEVPFTANNILQIIYKVIFGIPYYHLWYLYVIVGLYIITPPLRVFTANCTRRQLEYLLLLLFVFGLAEPLVNNLLSATNFAYSFSTIPELSGYAGYYIAGYYFSTYEVNKKIRKIVYIGFPTSILLTIVITYFYSLHIGKADELVYDNLLANTAFPTIAIFIGIKKLFENRNLSERNRARISKISINTFGIYLIHVVFLNLLAKYNVSYFRFSFYITIPITSIVVFGLSYFSTLLIRKIPIINQYIV